MAPSFGEGAVVERALVEVGGKYVRIQAEGKVEEVLFDLASDPGERSDLAREPSRGETLSRMRTRMANERTRLGDL